MKLLALSALLAASLAVAACDDKARTAAPPPPQALTQQAMGHYCGMNVLEHPGPKGQILLASRLQPVWFSSARDTLSFTLLPEEAKDIQAVYVSDMGKAPSWEEPGATNWVDARQALFVVGSNKKGGMGAAELVPFSQRSAAEAFVAEHGGSLVAFDAIPRDAVLGSDGDASASDGPAPAAGAHLH
ncbi:nitrous oxide reductase accessory protein NosL [Bosea sp. BIWAKO-01]|uniref:nitrous oxide reductase accessory protein NosL n=1 Tax=Bosea sp. BIWAKO-01 TaxID=506668 RepID=UPI00085302E4|nr:nitrous oxide reductase accessory protein NosL [Bosea sp. BIWAKO-01]GAU87072.1 nitrous oxide reductase maturation protein [Bosea sp. BIWAKO-01]